MALGGIGNLWVSLGLNAGKFNSGMSSAVGKASRSSKTMEKSFKGVEHSVGKLTAAIIALAGPAALTALTIKSFAAIDANAKLADSLGISTEKLYGLQKAAELSGASAEGMNLSLKMMQKNISDAGRGMGDAKVAFEKLGINIEDIKNLSPDEQFKVISKAMAGMTNEADRTAFAMKIFGDQGAKLINTMKMTPEQLAAVEKQMIAIGKATSRFDSAKIEQANDAMSNLGDIASGVGNRIAVGLSPYIQKFSSDLFNNAVQSQGWKDIIKKSIDVVITGIGWLGDAWRGLEIAMQTIKYAFYAIADGAISFVKSTVAALNYLPGVNIELSDSFNSMASNIHDSTQMAKQGIVDLVNQEWPHDKMKKWADEAEAQSNRAAAATAKAADSQKTSAQKTADAEKAKQDKITKETLKGAKEQFGITKAQNIAQAAANIPAAISGAYKVGAGIGGPLLGLGFGAAAGLYESKKLADVAGVSFGGGGGGASSGGGGGVPTAPTGASGLPPGATATPGGTEQPVGSTININVSGSDDELTTVGTTRRILERVGEEIKNNGGYIGDIKVLSA